MSIEALAWAWKQTTGSGNRKSVLVALANRHNADTGQCNPRVPLIAKECELTDRSVQRILKDLEGLGLITRVAEKRNNGSFTSNHFVLHMSPGGDSVSPGGAVSVTTPGDGVSPLEPEVRTGTEPEVEPSTAVAVTTGYDPVKGRRVDGRDLPWDAMVEATSAYGEANGARVKRALQSIRKDVVEFAGTVRVEAFLAKEGWEAFERTLADMITTRAEMLRERHPTLTWGPEGIARNWRLKPEENPRGVEEIVQQVTGGRS